MRYVNSRGENLMDKLQKQLESYTEKAFSPDGYLVNNGFIYSAEQKDYADGVCQWLCGNKDKPVSLIESETGTGKTLGYLIPLHIYLSLTGKRGIVSTYTIALQSQMINGDLSIAQGFLKKQSLPKVSWSQRLGRTHFVDPDRVELELSILESEMGIMPDKHHQRLLDWSTTQREAGTGLFESWYQLDGKLPEGITEQAICLTPESDPECNDGYIRHKVAATSSQLVITSHAMLFQNLRATGSLLAMSGELPVNVIIADEADHLQTAAESLSHRRIQPARINFLCQNLLANKPGSAVSKRLKNLLTKNDDLTTVLESLGSKNQEKNCLLLKEMTDKDQEKIKTGINELSTAITALDKTKQNSKTYSESQKDKLIYDELDHLKDWFNDYAKTARYDGISWSEHYRRPSVSAIDFMPGRRIRQYLTGNTFPACRVLLTSATLSGGKNREGDSFVDIRSELGIAANEVGIRLKLAPKRFGNMQFVLSSPQIARPFKKDEEDVRFNTTWLQHTSRMICRAAEEGNVLVLAGSFSEVNALFTRLNRTLPENKLHCHLQKNILVDTVNQFKKYGGVLVSPSLWEGFSQRKKTGGQLFTELVITRLPHRPPSAIYASAFIDNYLRQPGRRTVDAKNALFAKLAINAVRKLRQGIGRGIRHKRDKVTVWIADSRFPEPGSHKRCAGHAFVRAISQRFMDNYQQAKIFDNKTGKLKPVPEKTLENIVL